MRQNGVWDDALDHVSRDTVDLILRCDIGLRLEEEARIALDQTGANAFELFAILRRGRIVLLPDEMQHAFDPGLCEWLTRGQSLQTKLTSAPSNW